MNDTQQPDANLEPSEWYFTAPLSFAQERLWLLEQLEGLGPAYNIVMAYNIAGHLDVTALQHSLDDVRRRHEVLRTRLRVVDGQPAQVISPFRSRALEIVALEAFGAQRDAVLQSEIAKVAQSGFDLTEDELLRVALFRMAAEHYVLVFVAHHAVFDAWSMRVLMRDAGALYVSYLSGRPAPLPELEIQYADYAAWQRERLQNDALTGLVAYWRAQLAGAPAALSLPTDRPRPPVQSFRGAKVPLTVSGELYRQLQTLSRSAGVTLFMVLLGAVQVLLSRWSGASDIVVGSPIAGRTQRQTEGLIGLFLNTLVLRTDLSGDPSFRTLLGRVKEVALGAYAHQDLPFEKLVEELQPERDLSRQPLFQVLLALENVPQETVSLPGLTLRPLATQHTTAKLDLSLYLHETAAGLQGMFEYATDLFDAATIERLSRQFSVLLAAIVAQPDTRLSALPLFDDDERRLLLRQWNDTAAVVGGPGCLHARFAAQAARTPDAVAVVCGQQQLSYRELERRANQLAHHLRGLGIGPDMVVGLCVERSPEMLIGLLGVLKAGAAYLPLDPAYPPARLGYMLADAGVRLVLTQDRLAATLGHDGRMLRLDADWAEIAGHSAAAPTEWADPANLAYVIYTSGSTGRPKGAMLSHCGAVNLYDWYAARCGLAPGRRDFVVSSFAFDLTLKNLLGPLLAGATVVLGPNQLLSAAELQDGLARHAAQLLNCAPSQCYGMLQRLAGQAGVQLALEHVMLGGEAIHAEPLAQAQRSHPALHVLNSYGPTEITDVCLATELGPVSGALVTTLGRPLPNTRVYVLDAWRRLCPIGVAGELWVGGAGVGRGYLGRPGLTAERFAADCFGRGGRLYRTGDLVRWRPDGSVEFLGRIDQQIKLRGHRVEPAEIEAALLALPGVQHAAVTARTDQDQQTRLVAYVVAEGGEIFTTAGLRAALRRVLPDHMIPTGFVLLDALPLTPSGKIDRLALPEPGSLDTGTSYVAPRTPVEELLAGVWQEVLRRNRVGVNDNFFDLGGHSLMAMQLVARLHDALGVELPLRAVFEAPTVAELAERVLTARAAPQHPRLPPLEATPRPAAAPLSYAQERVWVLQQLTASRAYDITFAWRLEGALDEAALAQCFAELVRRHEILRTRFQMVDGACVQLPDPAPFRLRRSEEMPADTIALTAGAPFQVTLVRLSELEHVVQINLHHIIWDAWSNAILARDFAALYAAFSCGLEPSLPPLAVQYADYAAWQRTWLRGEAIQHQLDYWRAQLAGAPASLSLPTDHARPATASQRGASVEVAVSPALSAALQTLARGSGVTLFMVLLGALQVLLSRWSGASDIVVGSPIAGRTQRQTEGLIGLFLNTLVLRTDLSGDPSFRTLLGRVKEVALGAYAHQDLPFEKLVEELQPERDLSRQPLFQVLLALENVPQEAVSLPGLTLRPLATRHTTAKLDLSLYLHETAAGLQGMFEYATDLFDAATIERLSRQFGVLLAAIVAEPDARLSALSLLDEDERQLLLRQWNDTAAVVGGPGCLHARFAAQAARIPDAVALVYAEQQLSYRELERRANQLAHHLRGLGIGPDMVVGLCVERSAEMLVGLLGVLKAGAAYLPLDPAYPPARLCYMLADAGVRLVLTQDRLAATLGHDGPLLRLDADWAEIARQPAAAPAEAADPDNLAYVIYTSGSTGRPKGAMLSHRGAVNRLAWMETVYRLGPLDRVVQRTPYTFDVSIWELLSTLSVGATLVLPRPGGHADPDYLAEVIACQQITLAHFVPSMLQQFLQARGLPQCRSLREVFCTGEALPMETVRDFATKLAAPLNNFYGPTEASIEVSYWVCDPQSEVAKIGRPIWNTQLYVLDSRGAVQPIGVPGLLHIGGAGLARGYVGAGGRTAQAFVPSPFGRGGRLYNTGDLARWDRDGNLEFLGRLDEQIKLRGHRVELGEIEAVLLAHDGVVQAAVTVRMAADNQQSLAAYIVAAGGAAPDESELRRHLRASLPEHMVPATFTTLPALPVTSSGKLDRRALPAPQPVAAAGLVAPSTPVEELISELWTDLLGRTGFGVHENFFELGGHSLSAMSMVARLRDLFAVELPLRVVFESATIAGLADQIAVARHEAWGAIQPPLTPQNWDGPPPLSFSQERYWLLDQMGFGGNAYNVSIPVELTGTLRIGHLERSFNEVVRRHEALRTSFAAVDGIGVQVVTPELHIGLAVTDVSGLSEAEQADLLQADSLRDFDLGRGPLLRASVWRLGPAQHILMTTMHHIVADGWSISLLIREIATLYAAYSAGRASPLPELPIQYSDYAAWQRRWLQGAALERQIAYWRDRLAGAATLAMPTDRPRPPVATFQGSAVFVSLPQSLSQALQTLSRDAGVTLFMVLLGALQVLLSRWSGASDIVVGSPIAGRMQRQTEGLIGLFLNTLVLRTDLSGDPTFRTLLGRVKEVALGAYAHQDLPFEKLVEELQPERDLSRQPLFQVLLALENVPQETVSLPGLTLRPLATRHTTAKLDLSLYLHETAAGLQGMFEYATDLFDAATIERLSRQFSVLLAAIVAQPDTRLSALPLFDDDERRLLLRQWNDTAAVVGGPGCLHARFAAQAARTPDAVAVVYAAQQLSYRELERRANQLAHHLRGLGVGPDMVVGLCVERSAEMLIGLLGVLKAGAAYLPLDPAYPPARLGYMLADAGVRLVLTQDRLAATLGHDGRMLRLDADWAEIARQPADAPAEWADPANLAYVIYTSGSTGRPKGAMLSHRGAVNLYDWYAARCGLAPGRRDFVVSSFAFDLTLKNLLGPLLAGATVVLGPNQPLGAAELQDGLARHAAQLLNCAPSQCYGMLQRLAGQAGARLALEHVVLGGEAIHAEPLAQAQRSHPALHVLNSYGPTEITDVCLATELWPVSGALVTTLGRPLPNTRVYVLDAYRRLCPIGVAGELWVGGAGVGRGYLGRPGLTAERFAADCFGHGGRLYRTGDLVRWRPDGSVEFLGRIDQQIKLRGHRVEPAEIEAALLALPGVQHAAVTARTDQDQQPRLVAYVVAEGGAGSQPEPAETAPLQAVAVERWKAVFDEVFDQRAGDAGPSFAGWTSSSTGAPLPQSDMQEWLSNTVERIATLRPQRLLEIGCGVGLLLQHLAPLCQRYLATDLSSAAVANLRDWVRNDPALQHVELRCASALELGDLPRASFDVIVLNSVVQYFPDIGYLLAVLEAAFELLSPGGVVFVGDVRHYGLLRMFHTRVQLARQSTGISVAQLRDQIEQAIQLETELTLAPAFFHGLADRFPVIADVEIELKAGRADNEVVLYRYDVVLRAGERGWNDHADTLDWARDIGTPKQFDAYLDGPRHEALRLSSIPNRRLARDLAAMRLIETSPPNVTVAAVVEELRRQVPDGEHPDELCAVAERHGYQARTMWSENASPGSFEVMLVEQRGEPRRVPAERAIVAGRRPTDLAAYANDPQREQRLRDFTTGVYEGLRESLPEHMIPASIIMLDAMPLLPNGKLNRLALPDPPSAHAASPGFVEPSTRTEIALAGIWSEVLRLERISLHDSFFDLGGHSLLGMRVIAWIEDAFGVQLPLRTLFETPTLTQLAARIDQAQPAPLLSDPVVLVERV